MAAGKFVGMDRHLKRLRDINENTEPATIMALLEAGELVRQEAAASIRNGAIRGRGHVPAPPGLPPNGDTGRLELGIEVELRRSEKTVNVVSRAPYAAAQEFGSRHAEARPYLRPALLKHKNRLVTAMVAVASGEGLVRVLKGR